MSLIYEQTNTNQPEIHLTEIDKNFLPWLSRARERIFSLAVGDRVATLAPRIMEVGLGKILYAADQLGVDTEQSRAFVLFAPDGTVSYNPIRTQRGFSYGAMIHLDFDGLMATNNSMPNGCGFSLYEIIDPPEDSQLLNYLADSQLRLGQDQLSQLGKGNHFAGLYYVLDPLSGEDTGRRFVVIHCSGHVGGHLLYHPESWITEYEGSHSINTPHGAIMLLEDDAKEMYLKQFQKTETANSNNRDLTMTEIFNDEFDWEKLSSITHQGLASDGVEHVIGSQVYDGLQPIAFNPEEGLVVANTVDNLSSDFIDRWSQGERAKEQGVVPAMKKLNMIPHGGGYEFRFPLDTVEIKLSPDGIDTFTVGLKQVSEHMSFSYFREVREWMSYRRKTPIVQAIAEARLGQIEYELPCLIQIYPLVSIPGGSH